MKTTRNSNSEDWAGIVGLQGSKFEEVGTPGLEIYSGYVRQAYNAELYWP